MEPRVPGNGTTGASHHITVVVRRRQPAIGPCGRLLILVLRLRGECKKPCRLFVLCLYTLLSARSLGGECASTVVEDTK